MSRTLLYQAMKGSQPLENIVHGRIFQASRLGIHDQDGVLITDGVPEKPFITYRMHTDFPVGGGMGRREYSQVWANDDPGSYVQIDAVEAIPPQDGFLEARWVETGVDLKDDAMGTINRYIRFQMTGSLRERN
jgi:hypothetical protein